MARSLVISFAGLTPAAISCFGSSWNRTPALDGLAADGVCWDRLICHSTDPRDVWLDAWKNRDGGDAARPWTLITDDPSVRDRDEIVNHAEVELIIIESSRCDAPSTSIDQTHLASQIREAVDRLNESSFDGSLWIHSNFLTHCWDAPRDLFPIEEDPDEDLIDESWDEEESLVQRGDVDAPENACEPIFHSVSPPHHQLESSDHVDLLMAWMRTYGCQVRLIDHLMDDLIEAAEQVDASITILGTSGFSLGQNGWIGHQDGPLRSCHILVPMVVNRGGPLRVRNVVGTDQMGSIMGAFWQGNSQWMTAQQWVSWNEQSQDAESDAVTRIVTRSHQAKSCITMQDWFYVCDQQDKEVLFLKPDDVNDINDVSRLKPDVVEAIRDVGEHLDL